MRFLLFLLLSLSAPAADCLCPCECVDTGPTDTGSNIGSTGDTGSVSTSNCLAVLAGQSNAEGKTRILHEPIPTGAIYIVNGVTKSTYKATSVERVLLESGCEVHKWSSDGIPTSEWVSRYRTSALSLLNGRTPDVLVWIHGEAHTLPAGVPDGYAAEVESEVLNYLNPTLTIWPDLHHGRDGEANINSQMNALSVSRGDVAIVSTTSLTHHPDGLHYYWADPSSFLLLESLVLAEMP